MKKDFLFLIAQFLLFAVYFLGIYDFSFTPNKWVGYFLIFMTVLGFLIILLGIIHLNDNLTIFPKPKDESDLTSHGIYKYIRHPIYSGILLAMLSFGLYSGSLLKLGITGLLFLVFYYKSKLEEKYLLERHDVYSNYMDTTGRFFPKFFHKVK